MRITPRAKELIELLAEERGISQTAIFEQLVRNEAERIGLGKRLEASGRPEAEATSLNAEQVQTPV